MEKKWKVIYSTTNLQEAELLKSVLEDNNIEGVIILNKKDSAINTLGEVEVYVREELLEKAIQIINDFKS